MLILSGGKSLSSKSMVTTCPTIKKGGSYPSWKTANTCLDVREREEIGREEYGRSPPFLGSVNKNQDFVKRKTRI